MTANRQHQKRLKAFAITQAKYADRELPGMLARLHASFSDGQKSRPR